VHNPGDVIIQKFMLGGSGGSIDISRRLNCFSVFEDVLKPYITIEVEVEDNGDVLNHNVGLDGNNTLSISFSQPGQTPYVGEFVVTSIERGRSLENLRTAVYTMAGHSPHMTRFPRVQRAYRDKTATGIVEDLVNTYLTPQKPLVVADQSKGILGNKHMPYNINGIPIHKAIRSVLSRAASSKNLSSLYTIFENRDSIVVDTMEGLLEKAQSPTFTYYQRPLGQNFLRDQMLQNFIIISMKEHSRVDMTARTQDENVKAQPYDTFSGKMEPKDHGQKNAVGTFLNMAYNILRPPTQAATVMPERKKKASDLDAQSLTIHVALNTEITVGEGFRVDTLAPAGDTSTPVPDKIAGNLLATEIRHTVDLRRKMQGTSTIKGIKGEAPV
jgi:hypothetical protein